VKEREKGGPSPCPPHNLLHDRHNLVVYDDWYHQEGIEEDSPTPFVFQHIPVASSWLVGN